MSHDIILHNATNDSLKEFLSANLLLGEVRNIITAHGAGDNQHRLRLHRLLHLCQLRLHGSRILQRYQLRLDRLLHLQLCLQMILRRHQLHLYWCLLLLNLSLILVVYILLFLLLR